MAKRLYIYPVLSLIIIAVMLFLQFVLHLGGNSGRLFVPFVFSLIAVAVISCAGAISSLYSLIKKKQHVYEIIFLICNIVIPAAYWMWFSNAIRGM